MNLNKNVQTEVDASHLYQLLAIHETDPNVADIFRQMSAIEHSHAIAFLEKYGLPTEPFPLPSIRAKILSLIGKIMGFDFILGVLMDTEKSLSSNIIKERKRYGIKETSISDVAHVSILKNILDSQSKISGYGLARFEKRHRSVGGNALRAAVLGGNDGLVSNFSLVMGIAGATSGNKEVLLAGIAGLLAGALSMALGEWISVKSSQELYENQMALEMEELEVNPDGEEKELALIYRSKGVPIEQAKKMAADIIQNKEEAHTFLVREELGINTEEIKDSAMEAAITSFILFAFGAIIPVVPFFFMTGYQAIILSTVLSAFGLFIIGSAITLFTGKNIWYSGMRQVVFGLAAAGITYSIGTLIGIQIGG
ncbi:MAG: VIT1/CCC1 transporter family protein [Saprospiraceae bacterium]|nr:VIT1/CCC1 transporter family protein [Saprospiraceae bacterium]